MSAYDAHISWRPNDDTRHYGTLIAYTADRKQAKIRWRGRIVTIPANQLTYEEH